MSTIVEKTSSGIIYKASQQRDFPQLDLLSLLFGNVPASWGMAKEPLSTLTFELY